MADVDPQEFPYECSRSDCERRFKNEHGLAVHIARAHGNTGDDAGHESAAIEAAERQPHHDDEVEPEQEVEGGEGASYLHADVELDAEERELIAAVSFLFGYTDDNDVVCAALADFFEWARGEENVAAAVKLQRRARTAAK